MGQGCVVIAQFTGVQAKFRVLYLALAGIAGHDIYAAHAAPTTAAAIGAALADTSPTTKEAAAKEVRVQKRKSFIRTEAAKLQDLTY